MPHDLDITLDLTGLAADGVGLTDIAAQVYVNGVADGAAQAGIATEGPDGIYQTVVSVPDAVSGHVVFYRASAPDEYIVPAVGFAPVSEEATTETIVEAILSALSTDQTSLGRVVFPPTGSPYRVAVD